MKCEVVVMSEINGMRKDIEWIRESLERIEYRLDEMDGRCRETHSGIDRELAALKVRAGLYGAVAGAAPAVVTVIILFLENFGK